LKLEVFPSLVHDISRKQSQVVISLLLYCTLAFFHDHHQYIYFYLSFHFYSTTGHCRAAAAVSASSQGQLERRRLRAHRVQRPRSCDGESRGRTGRRGAGRGNGGGGVTFEGCLTVMCDCDRERGWGNGITAISITKFNVLIEVGCCAARSKVWLHQLSGAEHKTSFPGPSTSCSH